jgi:Ca2+-binding EF-hand superfamily protein
MEEQKKELRIKVLDENIFGPIVDNTFKDADINNSGFIEKNELFILLNKIRKNLDIPSATEKDVNNELNRLDTNKDGKISKNEFRELVKEIIMFSIDQLE